MAKVFTITEGLQNMGALKTGGQGSVYKGRRIGEIITAIKILPTPLLGENEEDKNYLSFANEVEKLKRVNEEPNPNVVKILNSGITDSGNFPFIEMEFIEGPELDELIKPPHAAIFTIKETLKVAEHLSHALAHCHKKGVTHGDIKSNNIKYNVHSGNYILLDFGLSVMSDEQRRTSLRHAGAIEFMAPEQNEGQVFFQTDVYSFGIIIYELLAGQVPFPLQDNGGTARNNIRIAHIETPVPDLLPLRQQNLPETWTDEMKQQEMQVPGWLISLVYKCLQKSPEDRYPSGLELSSFIVHNITLSGKPYEQEDTIAVEGKDELAEEKQELELQLQQLQLQLEKKKEEIDKVQVEDISAPQVEYLDEYEPENETGKVSKSAFITVLILAIALAGFAGYKIFNNSSPTAVASTTPVVDSTLLTDSSTGVPAIDEEVNPATTVTVKKPALAKKAPVTKVPDSLVNNSSAAGKYRVVSKAYFHSQPHATAKRKAFIVHWNKAVLTPLRDENGFVYVVFTNHLGQTSKGWLLKKDLALIK